MIEATWAKNVQKNKSRQGDNNMGFTPNRFLNHSDAGFRRQILDMLISMRRPSSKSVVERSKRGKRQGAKGGKSINQTMFSTKSSEYQQE